MVVAVAVRWQLAARELWWAGGRESTGAMAERGGALLQRMPPLLKDFAAVGGTKAVASCWLRRRCALLMNCPSRSRSRITRSSCET